jgi:hypothetical protein
MSLFFVICRTPFFGNLFAILRENIAVLSSTVEVSMKNNICTLENVKILLSQNVRHRFLNYNRTEKKDNWRKTFSHSRHQTLYYNPDFTVWPVETGASRCNNFCIDGGFTPKCFGYHLVHAMQVTIYLF